MDKNFDGRGSYHVPPGAVDTKLCGICGAICSVERNLNAPMNRAGAISHTNCVHDHFYCPNSNQDWHSRAYDIAQEYFRIPSKRIQSLLEQDWMDILEEHKSEIKS
jgi:hypothetical protein